MKTSDYCNRRVITTKADSSISEAARLMREHHVGCLVVVTEDDVQQPIGILTDRDIVVEITAQSVPPESVSVKDIMTSNPVVARTEDDILTTLKLMDARGARRIPVTDGSGRLAGILSTDDLLEVIHDSLGQLLSIYGRELAQEQTSRA
ncbi:MAG: CBS domain-containing protein [Gammaproteobacteria bacterium]